MLHLRDAYEVVVVPLRITRRRKDPVSVTRIDLLKKEVDGRRLTEVL